MAHATNHENGVPVSPLRVGEGPGEGSSIFKTAGFYLLLYLCIFAVYLRTLAPTIATLFDDSLEFQLVTFQPGIAHPTGYPLYTLLGKFFTVLPVGDVAYRVNLLSAVAAAGAVTLLAFLCRRLHLHGMAAVAGALAFALSRTFWSQTTIAEVYTLHALFVVLLFLATLRLTNASSPDRRDWYVWAFLLGLSLTHHRTILLLWPAIAVYLWWSHKQWTVHPPPWRGMLGAFALPLTLYLYIPLRGMTMTSLDGTYQNTWAGFLQWVTASGYGSFFSANPLSSHYTAADVLPLFLRQFGPLGWVLAAFGLLAAWRQERRLTGLLLLAGLTNVLFATGYRVADVQVFFIPVFLITAIFISWGVHATLYRVGRAVRQNQRAIGILLLVLFLLGMLPAWSDSFRAVDRRGQWTVYEDGLDAICQPLPPGSVIVGILGEMTRLRYFQQTVGLHTDLHTVAADQETERLAAIRRNLSAGHEVYTTRPLPGLEVRYALAAEGPLIRARSTPSTVLPAGVHASYHDMGSNIALLAYRAKRLTRRDNDRLRLTLYWKATGHVSRSLKVSARLQDEDGHRLAQQDSIPVHNAYPTTAWRAGEIVRDVYDLPLLIGQTGPYHALVLLYDPADLHETGRFVWSPAIDKPARLHYNTDICSP